VPGPKRDCCQDLRFILKHGGNIVAADQYSTDPEGGYFFMRVEFILSMDQYNKDSLADDFLAIGREFSAQWKIIDKSQTLRMVYLYQRQIIV